MKHTHRTFRKLIALLMAISMICSLAVTAWAEGDPNPGDSTFEADSLTPGTGEDAGTVTVTDDAALGEDVTDQTIPDQSVSVQFPVDDAVTEDPAGDVTISNDAVEYNAAEGSETVPVTEEFDLTAEITAVETDAEGNLTDITYDVSLDQQTTVGEDVNVTEDVDQDWNQDGNPPELNVELSINGMENPTRVEHVFEGGTEYFYNEANGTSDTTKKYFSVIQTLSDMVVSLKTTILGSFHITNDAFENQKNMTTSSNLAEAVKNAENGSTVEMLRDYTTDTAANVWNTAGKGDDITVDFNQHTYEFTDSGAAVQIAGSGQSLQFQNGTLNSSGNGIYVWYDDNSITLDNSTINAKDSYGIRTLADSANNSCGATINIQNNSTINSDWRGVQLSGNSNTLNVINSTINAARTTINQGYGVLVLGSGSKVTISNGNVLADSIAMYATGGEHTLAVDAHSVISAGTTGISISNAPKSTLLFKDSEINAASYGLYAEANGMGLYELTLLNSTINANGTGGWGVDIYGSGNTVNISGTTINAKGIGVFDQGKKNTYTIEDSSINFSDSFGIYHNGSDGGASFTVTGTTIDPGKTGAVGIYISGSSKTAAATDTDCLNSLILNGGTVAGYQSAVEVKFTDVTIDGSTLKGLGVPPEYADNNNGTTTTGAALAVTGNEFGVTGGTIRIFSGNFYGAKDFASIFHAVSETTGDDKATITIQGGRYVYPVDLRNYINTSTHGLISYNDGSAYPYAVIAMNATPARPGYVFQGYLDENGNPITLAQANATQAIAYAQWALASVEEPSVSAPEAPKDNVIIVEPDSQGNNVDIAIQDGTAQVTVSTPTGGAAAVSEVTITSIQELQSQGVDTVTVQIEENVTLELGVAQGTDNGLGDSIAITREDDTLVISSGEDSKITIHMEALKAAATDSLHIRYGDGVVTIAFGSTVVFRVEVLDALKTNRDLTVKLENGVLKLYDKQGTLLQEISM